VINIKKFDLAKIEKALYKLIFLGVFYIVILVSIILTMFLLTPKKTATGEITKEATSTVMLK